MTTTSLPISRKLQERWPERKAYFMYYKTVGLVEPAKWTIVDADDIYDYGEIGEAGTMAIEAWTYAEEYGKTGEDTYEDLLYAPTLDELRVFALELIGPEPDAYTLTSAGDERWQDWSDLMYALRGSLIQGCDPTAEWLLMTFGESNA